MDYNPKIYYLACKFLPQSAAQSVDEALSKKIFLKKESPKTPAQKLMVKANEIFSKFMLTLSIDTHCIMYTYEHYTDKELGKDCFKKNESLQKFHEFIKNIALVDYSLLKAISIFAYIIKNHVFPTDNLEIAKFFVNYFRIMHQKHPIIFYPIHSKRIENMILEDKSYSSIKEQFIMLEERTDRFNEKHPLITKEKIVGLLLEMQNELESQFGIKQIYLYGSYVRGEENEYSDLDIILETKEEYVGKISSGYIMQHLSKKLGLPVHGEVIYSLENYQDLTVDMRRDLTPIYQKKEKKRNGIQS